MTTSTDPLNTDILIAQAEETLRRLEKEILRMEATKRKLLTIPPNPPDNAPNKK